MIKINRRNLALWATILISLFFILSWLIPEPPFISLLNGVFFGISIAVAIVYSPLIWDSLRHSRFDRVAQLSIGIGLIWLSMFLQRGWSSFNRLFGDIGTAANSPVVAFLVFMAIVGGSLFVTAPGYYEAVELQPRFGGNNRHLLVILGLLGGTLTSVAYIVFGPNF